VLAGDTDDHEAGAGVVAAEELGFGMDSESKRNEPFPRKA
jgi:hypothetical protein